MPKNSKMTAPMIGAVVLEHSIAGRGLDETSASRLRDALIQRAGEGQQALAIQLLQRTQLFLGQIKALAGLAGVFDQRLAKGAVGCCSSDHVLDIMLRHNQTFLSTSGEVVAVRHWPLFLKTYFAPVLDTLFPQFGFDLRAEALHKPPMFAPTRSDS